jgi:hypothetical protein
VVVQLLMAARIKRRLGYHVGYHVGNSSAMT